MSTELADKYQRATLMAEDITTTAREERVKGKEALHASV